jgi:hypothetical protein
MALVVVIRNGVEMLQAMTAPSTPHEHDFDGPTTLRRLRTSGSGLRSGTY